MAGLTGHEGTQPVPPILFVTASTRRGYEFGSRPPSGVRPCSHTEGPRNSLTKRFGGLKHRTWPSVVTTWLLDGTFTTQPDQPHLDFWRHALERSTTACFCLALAAFFRFCLSGAAVCMMAHRATHLSEAFRSDSVSSGGSLLLPLPSS